MPLSKEDVVGVRPCCHGGEDASAPEPAPQPQASCCSGKAVSIDPGIAPDAAVSVRTWLRLGIALVLAGQVTLFGLGWNMAVDEAGSYPAAREAIGEVGYWILHGLLFAASVAVLALLGAPLLREFSAATREKRISVEALFLLSVIGALGGSLVSTLTGTGAVYYEVVAIVLAIYTVGKTLGKVTRARAVAEAAKLRDDLDWATKVTCCGQHERVRLGELAPEAEVAVAAGESFTVDGTVLSGEGFVRETALTGEPAPVVKRPGDRVFAGTESLDGAFRVRMSAGKGARKLDAVLATVEQARLAPSRMQEQADRLMQWFVPAVTVISLGTFVFWLVAGSWQVALFNAMAVLLVACPCALGLATPIAVFTGLMRLSHYGLVSRTGEFLDALARADTFIFDKTGTLSLEELRLADFLVAEESPLPRKSVREMVAAIEQENSHPIARALVEMESPCCFGKWQVQRSQLVPGQGVSATVTAKAEPLQATPAPKPLSAGKLAMGGIGSLQALSPQAPQAHEVSIGLIDLMPEDHRAALETLAQSSPAAGADKRRVYVCIDGKPAGVAILDEQMREGTHEVFSALEKEGVRSVILTGDPEPTFHPPANVALEAGLSPADKEDRVREWLGEGREVLFVGDGVNDAGAMALCPASIAMGGGTGLAKSTASAVLTGHSLSGLPSAVRLARRIGERLRGNMLFALSYNIIGMTLAATGILHPVVAALLMAASSAIVSIRAARSAKG